MVITMVIPVAPTSAAQPGENSAYFSHVAGIQCYVQASAGTGVTTSLSHSRSPGLKTPWVLHVQRGEFVEIKSMNNLNQYYGWYRSYTFG